MKREKRASMWRFDRSRQENGCLNVGHSESMLADGEPCARHAHQEINGQLFLFSAWSSGAWFCISRGDRRHLSMKDRDIEVLTGTKAATGGVRKNTEDEF